jgi:hypothetical protein
MGDCSMYEQWLAVFINIIPVGLLDLRRYQAIVNFI